MKEKIKKILILLNQYKIILIIILIGVGLFYWFQVRPSRIYSHCHKEAINYAITVYPYKDEKGDRFQRDDYEAKYTRCLRENGINK